jgi:hypothetical protein
VAVLGRLRIVGNCLTKANRWLGTGYPEVHHRLKLRRIIQRGESDGRVRLRRATRPRRAHRSHFIPTHRLTPTLNKDEDACPLQCKLGGIDISQEKYYPHLFWTFDVSRPLSFRIVKRPFASKEISNELDQQHEGDAKNAWLQYPDAAIVDDG